MPKEKHNKVKLNEELLEVIDKITSENKDVVIKKTADGYYKVLFQQAY